MKMMRQRNSRTVLSLQMQQVNINSNINPSIEITYQKMLKDKKDDPEKKIPPKFGNFVKSVEFKDLLEAMLDYCRELFRLENK